MDELLAHINTKSARKGNIIKEESLTKKAGKLYDGRIIIIKVFSDEIFPKPPFSERHEWSHDDINAPIIEEVDEPVAQTPRTPLTIGTRSIKRPPNQ